MADSGKTRAGRTGTDARDTTGPVLIELDESAPIAPEAAPPLPEGSGALQRADPGGPGAARPGAMQRLVSAGARPPSRLARWFWGLFLSLAGFGVSLWAWDRINALIARNPLLGTVALTLTVAFVLVCLAIVLRELAGFARLQRIDSIRAAAQRVLDAEDLSGARSVCKRLSALYGGRADQEWGMQRLEARAGELFDADGLLGLAETELLVALDKAAIAHVEAASRQVATVTAIVPLALADVVTALTANLRMIRRIAEVYGGRAGLFGSWRLARSVMAHLVATGAVAVGDDLIGSVAGGGVLSKISRRFGEGMINGALTARVGVAAMEVCRPLPFRLSARPSVGGIVQRALAGLFSNR